MSARHKLTAVVLGRASLVLALVTTSCGDPHPSTTEAPQEIRPLLLDALAMRSRPFEARLVGSPFAPFDAADTAQLATGKVRNAIRRSMRELAKHPSPETLGDAALAKLLADKPNEAVSLLEQAVTNVPNKAYLLSDLSAAYLVQATRQGTAHDDLAAALAMAVRALAADPNLREARYNEALALDKLHMRVEAQKAWNAYLTMDRASPWNAEAVRHLRQLEVPTPLATWLYQERHRLVAAALGGEVSTVRHIVGSFPSFARVYSEEQLLGQWATAMADGERGGAVGTPGRGGAGEQLSVRRAIGQALADINGEHMLQDAITTIERAAQSHTEQTDALVRGHSAFYAALAQEAADDYRSARAGFEMAAALLARANSPFQRWALLHVGFCRHFEGDPGQALALYASASSGQEVTRYPALIARSAWMTGLAHLVNAELPAALEAHSLALHGFELLRETPHVAFLESQIAVDLFFLGERNSAWPHRNRALSGLGSLEDPKRVYSVLWEAAQASLAEGWPETALLLLDELADAEAIDSLPGLQSETLLRRARIEHTLGSDQAASRDLASASALLSRIPDQRFRNRARGDLELAEGELHLPIEPRKAVNFLTTARDLFVKLGYKVETGD